MSILFEDLISLYCYIRQTLLENEKCLDTLNNKLDKIIKICTQMVSLGRSFNQEQEALVHSMWDLSSYFANDAAVQGSLNCMLDALQEASNYQKNLIDLAGRSIVKNFNNFIREDLKGLSEKRHWFEKSSSDLDNILLKASTAGKVHELEDLNKQVWATRQSFRHTAIDYTHSLSVVQVKKRQEVVNAVLSYTNNYSTFFENGSKLCERIKPSLQKFSEQVEEFKTELTDFKKSAENRHVNVNGDVMLNIDPSQPMQGYLFKRTNNAFKSWNRRYFTLQNSQLVYRKRTGDEVIAMEEDLRLCNVKLAADGERKFCFEVTSNVKSHMLQAENEELCQLWVDSLSRAISSAFHDQPQLLLPPGSSGDMSPGKSSSSSSTPPEINLLNNRERLNLSRKIVGINGNKLCCDCGALDPQWCSINLGITLCIECSGIHRSLGVHISKVRSLTLDHLDPEVGSVMLELGNEVVNSIFLYNLETHLNNKENTIMKPLPDSDRNIRENFIKLKYVEKKFVPQKLKKDLIAKVKSLSEKCQYYNRNSGAEKNISESHSSKTTDSIKVESPANFDKNTFAPNSFTDSAKHFSTFTTSDNLSNKTIRSSAQATLSPTISLPLTSITSHLLNSGTSSPINSVANPTQVPPVPSKVSLCSTNSPTQTIVNIDKVHIETPINFTKSPTEVMPNSTTSTPVSSIKSPELSTSLIYTESPIATSPNSTKYSTPLSSSKFLTETPSNSTKSSTDIHEIRNSMEISNFLLNISDSNDLYIRASAMGNLPLMLLSIAFGADKYFQDKNQQTGLHHAVLSNSLSAVEFLLLNGLKVNAQDGCGQTPLHLASTHANIIQVYRLLKYRSDWNIKDNESRTAVDCAVLSSEPDLVTLLRVAGLSEVLDKEDIEEEMITIMQDLYNKKKRKSFN